MQLSKLFRLGLAAKLAICVILSTAAFFAFFGFINLGWSAARCVPSWLNRPTASPI